VPYVSLQGTVNSIGRVDISDDKGTQLGSIRDVKPKEEFKAVTVLLNPSGHYWLTSNAGPQPINGSLTLQIKIEATLNLEANFIFIVDGKDFPVHKAILGGKEIMKITFNLD